MLILAIVLLQDEAAFRRADAMVDQLARSARLYTAHHGNLPASIDALIAAGFLPVEEAPKDPWGRAMGFAAAGDALEVKIEHETRTITVMVTKRQAGSRALKPGDRLAKMAMGAVEAYRAIHGRAPENLAVLTAEPAVLFSPKKAAGMKLVVVSYAVGLSVPAIQVDPLPSEALAAHLRDLGAEDAAVRDRATEAIRKLGPAALEPIRAARRTTKDPEVAARLQDLDGPMAAEKERIERAHEVVAYARTGGTLDFNERSAAAWLKSLVTAQENFRNNDLDRNNCNDYWTGDIAGLYCIEIAATSNPIAALNDVNLASADGALLKGKFENARVRYNAGLLKVEQGIPMPKNGYLFRTMVTNSQGKAYAQDTGDKSAVHNFGNFGAVAYPAVYGATGRHTFIINEGASIFRRDIGGEPVLKFPTAVELSTHWGKVE